MIGAGATRGQADQRVAWCAWGRQKVLTRKGATGSFFAIVGEHALRLPAVQQTAVMAETTSSSA